MDNGLTDNNQNELNDQNNQNIPSNQSNQNTPNTPSNPTDPSSPTDSPEEAKKKHGITVATIIGLAKLIWWLLRMLWKLLKGMWRHKIVSLIVMALVAVAVIALLMVRCTRESDSPFNIDLGINKGIEVTPNVLTEVKKIGQWEFLSISDEEMVDTVRKGFFTDDELIRIYYGTLRLGIDFSQCEGEWIRTDGDSIILDLPPVKLLDDDFLDETRTQPFIESGKWSNADRQQMAERAKAIMRERCLTPENLALAQKTADRQLRQFLEKIMKEKQ